MSAFLALLSQAVKNTATQCSILDDISQRISGALDLEYRTWPQVEVKATIDHIKALKTALIENDVKPIVLGLTVDPATVATTLKTGLAGSLVPAVVTQLPKLMG